MPATLTQTVGGVSKEVPVVTGNYLVTVTNTNGTSNAFNISVYNPLPPTTPTPPPVPPVIPPQLPPKPEVHITATPVATDSTFSRVIEYTATTSPQNFTPFAMNLEINCPEVNAAALSATLVGDTNSLCFGNGVPFDFIQNGIYKKRIEYKNINKNNIDVGITARAYTNADQSVTDGLISSIMPTTPPSVTLINPNGGEQLYTGNTYTLTWSAVGGLDTFYIYYIKDGRDQSQIYIDTVTGVSSYDWKVPQDFTEGLYKIMVVGNSSGNQGPGYSDMSNDNIFITLSRRVGSLQILPLEPFPTIGGVLHRGMITPTSTALFGILDFYIKAVGGDVLVGLRGDARKFITDKEVFISKDGITVGNLADSQFKDKVLVNVLKVFNVPEVPDTYNPGYFLLREGQKLQVIASARIISARNQDGKISTYQLFVPNIVGVAPFDLKQEIVSSSPELITETTTSDISISVANP